MHLSGPLLLSWLVLLTGPAFARPTSRLLARATSPGKTSGVEGNNDFGEKVRKFAPAAIVGTLLGVAVRSPDIIRWYQNRRAETTPAVSSSASAAVQHPEWYTIFNRYYRMSPEQRAAENHRTLLEIELTEEEKGEVRACQSKKVSRVLFMSFSCPTKRRDFLNRAVGGGRER